MLYHGGTIFGRSEDNPVELSKTLSVIKAICLNGGRKVLIKMMPISKLRSAFLFEQINLTNQKFDSVSANVKAIICDGNRIIQASFKMYTFVPRHNDPLQAVIHNLDDNRLNLILQFGDKALKMAGPKGKRIKQFSKDTATCIHQTCYGLVDLCRYLLNTTQNYVLLGQFTSDHMEKE